LIICLLNISTHSLSQDANAEKRKKQFNISDGVAIDGYDPVSYFTEGKAVKENKQYSAKAAGILYYLSSEKNKSAFIKDYKKYEPQYGGWCAYAMGSSGEKVEIDPETFKIIDGKLFLFYNAYLNNTLKSWNKDEVNLKKKADTNWNTIVTGN